ncbi:unnamed protein product [Rangifer tarandus platyrhynchus]|uniref:Uncharacterized protein n=1 Tax=Rangifer tarandus platyrhynchus TaxID=3082113 RepID=A0AC59ZNZ4_RANTA
MLAGPFLMPSDDLSDEWREDLKRKVSATGLTPQALGKGLGSAVEAAGPLCRAVCPHWVAPATAGLNEGSGNPPDSWKAEDEWLLTKSWFFLEPYAPG